MLHIVAVKIANLICNDDDKYPIEIYIYGIELMISSVIGTIIVISCGVLFNLFIESLIFSICLSGVRFYSGGYHAKTYLKCNIVYLLSFILGGTVYMFYLKYLTDYNTQISLLVMIVSTLIMFLFAPVENKNKPIENDKKSKFKWLSIIISLIEIGISLMIFKIFNFHQVLMILPTILIVDISVIVEVLIKNHNLSMTTE